MAGGRKYSYDDDFFKNINSISAYWAGFAAADAYIAENKKHRVCFFGMKLAEKDLGHIKLFCSDTKYTGKIRSKKEHLNRKVFNQNVIQITGIKDSWKKDLLNIYNITPAKSLTLQPPNLTEKEHIFAYIKGLICGDGHIGIHNGYFQIHLVGSEFIIKWC